MKSILDQLPWGLVAGWLSMILTPYLSALVTKAPSWATGAITGLQAFLASFFGELSDRGISHLDWKLVIGMFFVDLVSAYTNYKVHAVNSQPLARLYAWPHQPIRDREPAAA